MVFFKYFETNHVKETAMVYIMTACFFYSVLNWMFKMYIKEYSY